MILWSEKFATGSNVIDQQHRMLINHINHLEWMVTSTNLNREDCEYLIHLTSFLQSYAEKHFQYEEECMENYRCPASEKNKQAHAGFLAFFRQFKKRCEAEGFRPEMLRTLHQTLSSWITEHILAVDTRLKPCIAAAAEPVLVAA